MRFALAFLLCASSGAQSNPFTLAPALPFVHRNSPTAQKYLLETMAGGVALLDYNNDGLLDIFLVNGGKLDGPVKLPANFARRDPPFWNRLYRQNPNHTFTDVTAAAGLDAAPNHYGMGIAVGDYDNNGFPDLYVTGHPVNALYRNNGDGTFSDVTAPSHTAASGWSVSAAFLDYDNDGRLDLFVSRYLDWDLNRNILCGTPFHAYCRPDRFNGVANLLFHNEGQGVFRDVSKPSGISTAIGKGMGVAVNDFDADHYPDIYVSNDGMEQFLFHNQRNGTFREIAMDAGVALSGDGKPFSGMGAAFADYDNDARPDLLVTDLALEKYALYRNEGGGRFTYATLATGLAALTARNSGWGVAFLDYDNDGRKDILAAQSHVLDNVEKIHTGLRYLEPPALLRNAGPRFEAIALPTFPAVAGRGAAFGDLNNDGAIDAVISVLGASPLIMLNRPAPNRNALLLKLTGTRANRDAAGAIVRAAGQTVYATTSGSYLSASDIRVHLGIGSATQSPVEVIWPGGRRQSVPAVAAGRPVTIKEQE